jgi:prevent-host-death family protein
MASVGVRELKNRLTRYLQRVRFGEEVVVTDRGKAIAIIRPILQAEPVKSLDARLATLAAQGMVTLPTRKLVKRIRRVEVSGTPVSKTILAERR